MRLDRFVAERSSSGMFRRGLRASSKRAEMVRSLIGARHRAGMSQSEVAKQMGTTQSAVSDIENGNTDPCISTLQRYASATGVEIDLGVRPVLEVVAANVTIESFSSEPPIRKSFSCAPNGKGQIDTVISWNATHG